MQNVRNTFIVILPMNIMVEIRIKSQINAPAEKVWNIVSTTDNDPEFWRGITKIRNSSKDGNTITREITKGKDNKFLQTITFFPKEGLNIKWTKGKITGTEDIVLTPLGNTTLLEVHMRYQLSRITSFMSGHVEKDLQREAEDALQLITQKAEGKSTQTIMTDRKSWADLVNEKLGN